MAQAIHESDLLLWLQGMPVAVDRWPVDRVKHFLRSRLREVEREMAHLNHSAPSADWLLQRAGEPFIDLNAPAWDPLLYLEYLKATRRAIVTTLHADSI
jgi:hypothetical protein